MAPVSPKVHKNFCDHLLFYEAVPARTRGILKDFATIPYTTAQDLNMFFAASCAQDGHFKHGSDFAFGGSDGHGYWKLEGKE